MNVIRLALCVAALVLALPAQAGSIDYDSSEITFVSRQMNVPVEGRFRSFTAEIDFHLADLARSKARIEVGLASVDTGSDEADTEVKRRNWFNVLAFPAAQFVSTGVKQVGPARYEARGELSIKGITREITAPFTVTNGANFTVFEGGFTLYRLQFKIGEGVWSETDTVANEVQVRFRITQTGGVN
ncbi:MAG TPA: YceI family protein [Burkholderiales bacterium]|nr:YceI family protein [Burkholderiales bacterium]